MDLGGVSCDFGRGMRRSGGFTLSSSLYGGRLDLFCWDFPSDSVVDLRRAFRGSGGGDACRFGTDLLLVRAMIPPTLEIVWKPDFRVHPL